MEISIDQLNLDKKTYNELRKKINELVDFCKINDIPSSLVYNGCAWNFTYLKRSMVPRNTPVLCELKVL